jgi:ABC-type iron transport system FetAB ATPase subunit
MDNDAAAPRQQQQYQPQQSIAIPDTTRKILPFPYNQRGQSHQASAIKQARNQFNDL